MTERVLLTGATGHIGFQVLLLLLQDQYHVHCAVRSEAKAESLRSHPLVKKLNLPSDALTFVTVPDITSSGAYNKAIKDCTYAIHVASAIPANNYHIDPADAEEFFVVPAITGTLEMLKAAQRTPSIKRVVITSSVVAIVPFEVWNGIEPSGERTFGAGDRNPASTTGPYESLQRAYNASKTASLKTSEAWVAKEKPDFQVINVHPGFVLGRNDLATTAAEVQTGTNNMALMPIMGVKRENKLAGSCCHVVDVARTHTAALKATLSGLETGQTRSFPVSMPIVWDDVLRVAKQRFPEAVEKGRLPLGGGCATTGVNIDSSDTEELLGSKLKGFEEQVVNVVEHLLEVQGEPAR